MKAHRSAEFDFPERASPGTGVMRTARFSGKQEVIHTGIIAKVLCKTEVVNIDG
jgi:hypothetical protein